MIYQCYFKKGQEKLVFNRNCYKGFGLEPEVNLTLFLNCPELKSNFNRLQLTEYAAFLWHYRNTNNLDWIGFTSYRQLDKFPFVFESKDQIEKYLEDHQILAWGEYALKDRYEYPISLEDQARACHPGLNEFIFEIFNKFGYEVPKDWIQKTNGFFANYWVMSFKKFVDYMEYSLPLVLWSLENIKQTDYYKTQNEYGTVSNSKCVGYFMERLFILWYLTNNYNPHNPGSVSVLHHNYDKKSSSILSLGR